MTVDFWKGETMKKLRKSKMLCLILTLFLLMTGCSNASNTANNNTNGDKLLETELYLASTEQNTENNAASNEEPTNEAASDNKISMADIPDYSGEPYIEINSNIPFFSEEDKQRTDAFENYSELDALGRCGVAYANICKELQPTEERGSIGQVKPSGWHTVKYNGYVEGNYLYNRCHLIGYQLAGENANEKNLITGTRYMNCDGQLPFEDEVDDYVDKTGNHVLYRVTPIFGDDNLVAYGVLTEAYSVEDKGQGVQFCVYCYNVQPGIEIDYKTGESKMIDGYTGEYSTSTYFKTKKVKSYAVNNGTENDSNKDINKDTGKTASEDTSTSSAVPEENNAVAETDNGTNNEVSNDVSIESKYIANTSTKKFHVSTCKYVKSMSEDNKLYSESYDELISEGYEPCKVCIGQ